MSGSWESHIKQQPSVKIVLKSMHAQAYSETVWNDQENKRKKNKKSGVAYTIPYYPWQKIMENKYPFYQFKQKWMANECSLGR